MAYQRFIRRGISSNATARRLIARSGQIAPHVQMATIFLADGDEPVCAAIAQEPMKVGKVILVPGERYYAVESEKFAGYYYVVAERCEGQVWQFSGEVELARKYIGKARAYAENCAS